METQKVGIREFRDKLASYVLDSEVPLAITKHGDTVGVYIPTRRKPTEAEKTSFAKATAALHESLVKAGATENDILDDFRKSRIADRRRK